MENHSDIFASCARKNLAWFRQSPIMADEGCWGVGERLLLTRGNLALAEIHGHFPCAISCADGLECLEQRRSDCNFEAALLFWLAGELLDSEADKQVARNLLDFLYFRSGLLNRNFTEYLLGGWAWNNEMRHGLGLWFDDNGWVCAIQLFLGRHYAELDKRYEMIKWGKLLAIDMLKAFQRSFRPSGTQEMTDPERIYHGRLELPHWAVPLQCALALYLEELTSADVERDAACAEIARYLEYILTRLDILNASELGYLMLLGGTLMQNSVFAGNGRDLCRAVYAELQRLIAENPYGIPPAAHFETPVGPQLADLIYTLNFCFAGLTLASFGDETYLPAARKLGIFLAEIQDDGADYPALAGCWRGMYDCQARRYGGGNCYEGGADSIYSGWTNAPIALAMLLLSFCGKGNLLPGMPGS